MSKKDKKQIKQKPTPTATQSSMSFSFNKWFRKILTIHPSAVVVTAIMIGYALFLFGGGLFSVVNEVPPAVWSGTRFYFLYPSLSEQFMADTGYL